LVIIEYSACGAWSACRPQPTHRLRIKAGAPGVDEIVEAVLLQQMIQPPVERMTRGRRQVVATHIGGCRSRLRLPIDMR
jgi:hypothetical protein